MRLHHVRRFRRAAIVFEPARAFYRHSYQRNVAAPLLGCRFATPSAGNHNRACRLYLGMKPSGMKPVGMKRIALLLAALAALPAAPARAQTDFLTLEENIDASGTALMCPRRANSYIDCADAGALPVPNATGRAEARQFTAHRTHDRRGRREARHRGWQDRLYLHAHGERRHGSGKADHGDQGHARRHSRR